MIVQLFYQILVLWVVRVWYKPTGWVDFNERLPETINESNLKLS